MPQVFEQSVFLLLLHYCLFALFSRLSSLFFSRLQDGLLPEAGLLHRPRRLHSEGERGGGPPQRQGHTGQVRECEFLQKII